MKFSSTWMWATVLVIIWTLLTVTVWAQGQDTPPPTPAPAAAPAAPATEGPAIGPAPENQAPGQTPPADNGGETKTEDDKADGDKAGDDQGGGEGQKPGGFFDNPLMFGVIGLVILYIFMISRSRKKTENKRKEMLAAIKPGEKVMTIGGLIGTVASAKEDEIVVKSGDQKLTFARWAIRTVGDDVKTEKGEDSQDKK